MSRSRPSSVSSLKADPAKHGFEVGSQELVLARASHAAMRRRKAIEIVSGTGDSFAAYPHTSGARKSTKISDNGIRLYFACMETRLMRRRNRPRGPLRVRPR
jgi:hypothetical protein